MKKATKLPNMMVVSIKMPESLYKKVKKKAAKTGISLGAKVREMAEKWTDEELDRE